MKFFLTGFAIGVLLLFVLISLGAGSKVQQPISFNHKKHVAQGLDCDHCHPYFKEHTFSGLPTVSTCLECHKEPLTQNPEEEKIRKYLQAEKRRSPGSVCISNLIMSSFPIGAMSSWERFRARPAMEISLNVRCHRLVHG